MVIKLELPLESVFIIYRWLFKSQFWETIMTLQYEPGVVNEFFFLIAVLVLLWRVSIIILRYLLCRYTNNLQLSSVMKHIGKDL